MNRREWLLGCLSSAAVFAAGSLAAAPPIEASGIASGGGLSVIPLGTGPTAAELQILQQALLAFYPFSVTIEPPRPLPRVAYYPPRGRYRAERLLEYLRGQSPPSDRYLMGVTKVDISTKKHPYVDYGILGLAECPGQVSVVSSYRCHRTAENSLHAAIRFGKVAVHEFGHVLGLPHCETRGCLLEDAGGTVHTLEREHELCSVCRGRLRERGIVAGPGIDWSLLQG